MHKEDLSLPFVLPEEWVNANQCVAILTGGTEASFVKLVDEGKISLDKPVYIIASGYSNSLAASLESLTWLQQHGGKGRVITDPQQINEAVNDDEEELKPIRLGVIGEPSDWLIASHVDDATAASLNVELVHVPIEEVTSLGEVDGGLEGAERIYQRLKDIVARYDLYGLTLRCFDLLTREIYPCCSLCCTPSRNMDKLVSKSILREFDPMARYCLHIAQFLSR